MKERLTIVRIPKTPAAAFDKNRPASDLLKAQVRHAREELEQWFEAHAKIDPDAVKTEQEGADYVQKVTRLLHPEGAHATASALPANRAPKSGVWLGPQKVGRTEKAKSKTRKAAKASRPASQRGKTRKKRPPTRRRTSRARR